MELPSVSLDDNEPFDQKVDLPDAWNHHTIAVGQARLVEIDPRSSLQRRARPRTCHR